jgi:hypothetical protein
MEIKQEGGASSFVFDRGPKIHKKVDKVIVTKQKKLMNAEQKKIKKNESVIKSPISSREQKEKASERLKKIKNIQRKRTENTIRRGDKPVGGAVAVREKKCFTSLLKFLELENKITNNIRNEIAKKMENQTKELKKNLAERKYDIDTSEKVDNLNQLLLASDIYHDHHSKSRGGLDDEDLNFAMSSITGTEKHYSEEKGEKYIKSYFIKNNDIQKTRLTNFQVEFIRDITGDFNIVTGHLDFTDIRIIIDNAPVPAPLTPFTYVPPAKLIDKATAGAGGIFSQDDHYDSNKLVVVNPSKWGFETEKSKLKDITLGFKLKNNDKPFSKDNVVGNLKWEIVGVQYEIDKVRSPQEIFNRKYPEKSKNPNAQKYPNDNVEFLNDIRSKALGDLGLVASCEKYSVDEKTEYVLSTGDILCETTAFIHDVSTFFSQTVYVSTQRNNWVFKLVSEIYNNRAIPPKILSILPEKIGGQIYYYTPSSREYAKSFKLKDTFFNYLKKVQNSVNGLLNKGYKLLENLKKGFSFGDSLFYEEVFNGMDIEQENDRITSSEYIGYEGMRSQHGGANEEEINILRTGLLNYDLGRKQLVQLITNTIRKVIIRYDKIIGEFLSAKESELDKIVIVNKENFEKVKALIVLQLKKLKIYTFHWILTRKVDNDHHRFLMFLNDINRFTPHTDTIYFRSEDESKRIKPTIVLLNLKEGDKTFMPDFLMEKIPHFYTIEIYDIYFKNINPSVLFIHDNIVDKHNNFYDYITKQKYVEYLITNEEFNNNNFSEDIDIIPQLNILHTFIEFYIRYVNDTLFDKFIYKMAIILAKFQDSKFLLDHLLAEKFYEQVRRWNGMNNKPYASNIKESSSPIPYEILLFNAFTSYYNANNMLLDYARDSDGFPDSTGRTTVKDFSPLYYYYINLMHKLLSRYDRINVDSLFRLLGEKYLGIVSVRIQAEAQEEETEEEEEPAGETEKTEEELAEEENLIREKTKEAFDALENEGEDLSTTVSSRSSITLSSL